MSNSLGYLLILTLITGTESITTISKVPVKVGTSISIPCLYQPKYRGHVKYLCKGYYWNSCQYAIKTHSPKNLHVKYSISDDESQNIFNVTIKQLTTEDSHYWCAVEINNGGDTGEYFQLFTRDNPSLYVTDQMVTGFIGENTTITCYYRAKGKIDWCKLGRTCIKDELIDGITVNIDKKNDSFSVTMSGLRAESSGWYYCVNGDLQMPIYLTVAIRPTVESTTVTAATESATVEDQKEDQKTREDRTFPALLSLIIPLVSLILVAVVALLVLFRTKRAKIQDSSGSSNLKEGEVTYSEVSFKKTQALPVESDGDVTYSSVVIKKPQGGKKAKAKDENVTHSHHKQDV